MKATIMTALLMSLCTLLTAQQSWEGIDIMYERNANDIEKVSGNRILCEIKINALMNIRAMIVANAPETQKIKIFGRYYTKKEMLIKTDADLKTLYLGILAAIVKESKGTSDPMVELQDVIASDLIRKYAMDVADFTGSKFKTDDFAEEGFSNEKKINTLLSYFTISGDSFISLLYCAKNK